MQVGASLGRQKLLLPKDFLDTVARYVAMKRFLAAVLTATLLSPIAAHGAETKTPAQSLMSKLQWRSIGPYIGGRVVAIAGVPSEPDLFYMGGVQGGIWKSTNYGQNWTNISDDSLPRQATSIGA